MKLRMRGVSILMVFGLFFVIMPAISQTRTNTEELGQKLLKESSKIRDKAHAAQAAVDAAKRKMAENNERIAELDQKRQRIRDEKAKLLGEVVWDIMNDPKIGQLARAKPQRVRMIPAIQEVLKNNPWIDPVLIEILKDYQ